VASSDGRHAASPPEPELPPLEPPVELTPLETLPPLLPLLPLLEPAGPELLPVDPLLDPPDEPEPSGPFDEGSTMALPLQCTKASKLPAMAIDRWMTMMPLR
jgi:hypothetical protein